MQLGFNTNVRYRAAQFHVQTEDSGTARPHVITHLYHEGVILASDKREYSHLVGREDLQGQVRALMDEQHQAMVGRLRSGKLDAVLRERLPALFGEALQAPGDTGQAGRDTQPSSLAPPPPERPAPPSTPRAAGPAEPPAASPAFEDELEAEKPLDELILQYLIDNARNRGRGR